MLLAAGELLYEPLRLIVESFELSSLSLDALGQFKCTGGRILGHLKLRDDLRGNLVSRLRCLDLESKLQFVWRQLVDVGVQPIGCLVVAVDTVVHHEELTVRWTDSQRP